METIEPLLTKHPLFENLEPQHIKLLVGCAKNIAVKPDQYIFKENAVANLFYVIRKGRVNIETLSAQSGIVTIQSCTDGEIIGWSSLFPPYKWHFDARAVELTRLVAFDAKCLRTKFNNDHNFGYKMLSLLSNVLADRLDAIRIQLINAHGD
jgi:CRP-like cAMP-binding protein